MNKKVIADILSISILTGLAGCSNGVTETTPASSTEATVQITIESTEEEETTTTEATTTVVGTVDLLEGYDTFIVSSEALEAGVWNDRISNTQRGENLSPDLSWEEVDGAELYVIYMVDPDGGNWIHWKSDNITETSVPEGWATSPDYVGPYPPEGTTHHYDVYVVALKAPVDHLSGSVDSANPNFPAFLTALDTDAERNEGNIIAYGRLSGTFTST